MRYYAVHTDYTDPFIPMHIKDKRKLSEIAKDLFKDGYVVSESVKIRQAYIGYNDGETTVGQHYFSADPQGGILFPKDHVRHIAEVVVPQNALPMPDE
ncbi:MAG: hypothetical protein ABTQ31_18155 [Rhizobiaceae bacterium]